MSRERAGLRIAYLHYGEQSGVTRQVTGALEALGHRVVPVFGRGPLELRDPLTRRPRLSGLAVAHLAMAALRFGRHALSYRWNTPFAFDVHSRWAGELLAELPAEVDVVLQNGALFAPGLPPRSRYVLLVDHTRALAERHPPAADSRAPPAWGHGWREREGETYRGASGLAAFSEATARSLVVDYGVARERVAVVGAGPNVPLERVERRDDGDTILFVGRDFARKGGPFLLEAFCRLRARHPRARLRIVGPAAPLDLPHGAEQLGPVAYADLPGLLAEATVFALPTLSEPFGIAFLDAMAAGLPCVGTRIEAVPEIIEEGRTGLLVPPGDPAALASALQRLLDAPALAHAMGERGRERVLARFTWERVATALGALLERASRAPAPWQSLRGVGLGAPQV